MNPDDLDRIINSVENLGFIQLPLWMAESIQSKNPRMTVYLANSKAYRLNKLDRVLGTAPLMQKINMEAN